MGCTTKGSNPMTLEMRLPSPYTSLAPLPSPQSGTSDTYIFPEDMDIMLVGREYSYFDSLAPSDTDSSASQLPTPVDDAFANVSLVPEHNAQLAKAGRGQKQTHTDDFDSVDTVLSSGVEWDEASGQYLLTEPREVPRKSFYDYYYPKLQDDHWHEYYREQERLKAIAIPPEFDRVAPAIVPAPPSDATPTDSELESTAPVDLSPSTIDFADEEQGEDEDLNPDSDCVYRVSRGSDGLLWYQCKTCPNRGTHRRSDMVRHATSRLHKPESLMCTLCDMNYPSKVALERHYQRKSHRALAAKNKARYNLRKRVGRK